MPPTTVNAARRIQPVHDDNSPLETEPNQLLAFVINLDRAESRWTHVTAAFQTTGFQLIRVPAVDGITISPLASEFDPARYRRRHGRQVNLLEVACYLSHMRALAAFLSATRDEHALILEDDVIPGPAVDSVTQALLRIRGAWDVIRLSGLSLGKPLRVATLGADYSLCVNLGRLKGTGAYLVNRTAARRLVTHLLPMTVPFDHALDREWFHGLRAFSALPFPISQTDSQFPSSIQGNSQPRLSRARRYAGTYPYQAFNELTRYVFRLGSFASTIVHPAIRAAARTPRKSDTPGDLPLPADPPAARR